MRFGGPGRWRKHGELNYILAFVLALLLVAGAAAAWFFLRSNNISPYPTTRPDPPALNAAPSGLSAATLAVLKRLNAPVEIRFYSVLDKARTAAALNSFADRLSQLLAEYERAGAGQIRVKRFVAGSDPQVKAAAMEDGITPTRVSRGEMNFLGLAVSCQGQRAVLPNLAPEWEAAAEFDLSRAIARVSGGSAGGELLLNPPPASLAATEELLRAMPEVQSLSPEVARQKVREAGLDEFKIAAAEIQNQIRESQLRLAQARHESAEAEQSARQELQTLQSKQNETLGEISRRMQARMRALEQLKQTGR